MRRVRWGDDELNFTPEEQAYVQEAEGGVRRPRCRRAAPHRHAGRADPHGEGGGGLAIGFVIACILVVFLIGLDEVRTADRARNTQRAAVGAPAGTRAGTRPQPPRGQASPNTRRRQTRSGTRSPRAERSEAPRPTPAPPPMPPRESFPPSWGLGRLTATAPLLASPHRYAGVLARMPAGTDLLIRRVRGSSCWHAAFLLEKVQWGYTCVYPQGADSRYSSLPPRWKRAAYAGAVPGELHTPGARLLPGTEVVMRRVGNTNTYFVISDDGETFGYGVFRADIFETSLSVARSQPGQKGVKRL